MHVLSMEVDIGVTISSGLGIDKCGVRKCEAYCSSGQTWLHSDLHSVAAFRGGADDRAICVGDWKYCGRIAYES